MIEAIVCGELNANAWRAEKKGSGTCTRVLGGWDSQTLAPTGII